MAKKRNTNRIQELERRDWQLMIITLVLLLCLAAFIIAVFFYMGTPYEGERVLDSYNMNVFLYGFTAFILLFCGYMVVKEMEIKKLKHILMEDQIRINTLKEVDDTKTELVSVVSHELRSPLTSVKNSVDIISGGRTGEINENQRKFLDIASRNINRLMLLINDLLDISKIEAGKMNFNFGCIDLNDPIDSSIATLKSRSEMKSIMLYKEIKCDLPQVYGESDKIEQIFINLIDNALKFTNDGGEVRISVKDFLGEGPGEERFIEVSVEDNGIGMQPDVMEKVFDRFYQVEKSLSTTARKGTGLGLAIIKGLIEGLNGKIWVESEPEKGTKFIFILPQYNSQRILTGLVDKAIKNARENKTIFSLMLVNLDSFGYLRKTYGDKETFKLMDQVCKIVYESIRKDRDTLEYQRLEGRVIVILNGTPKEGSKVVERRIKDTFYKHGYMVGNKSVKTSLSLGLSTYPEEGTSGDELINKAKDVKVETPA